MGIDFIKETTDRLAKEFIGYDLEKPLSEDLPDNIKEIDRVVGESNIDFDEPYRNVKEKLVRLLESKRVMPEWDLDDLCLKVIDRFTLNTHSWDCGLAERRTELLTIYERLKDRPCVKRIVEITGHDIPHDTLISIAWIEGIDLDRSEGKSYANIYSDFFQDSTVGALPFLNHLEETHKAIIHSVEQFRNLLGDVNEHEIESCSRVLHSAFDERYDLTLNRILREGGKYKQLLAINPIDFHLPDTWHGHLDESMTKDKMILKAIADYFNLRESDYTAVRHLSIRDIANHLEAPHPEILKASRYYQEHFYGFENEAS